MSKGYLCMDLKDDKGNFKTCYLLYDEIDKLIKFTSYCTGFDMFLNTLTKDNDLDMKSIIRKNNFSNCKIYYKKNKSSEKLDVLYSDNLDLFYITPYDVYNFLKKEGLICYNGNFINDELVKKIYSLMESLITSEKLRLKIKDNFNEQYDSDKYDYYVKFQNYEIYKKIAMSSSNILAVINYILSDPYKQLIFLKALKEITGKTLLSKEKLNINKNKIDCLIYKKGFNPKKMIDIINKNILDFLNYSNRKNIEFHDNNYSLENDEDFTERYEKMLEDESINPDLKDDIVLYIDAQKEKAGNNRLK